MNKFMPMMRKALATVPFAALALLVTGCFPMRYSARTGAQGTVVDAKTGAPLVGAEVFFSEAPFSFYFSTNQTGVSVSSGEPPSLEAAFNGATKPIVFTDTEGRFTIPRVTKWGMYFIGEDFFGITSGGTLVVRKDGYRPELRYLYSFDPKKGKVANETNVPMTKIE